jgi:hypothetical protein
MPLYGGLKINRVTRRILKIQTTVPQEFLANISLGHCLGYIGVPASVNCAGSEVSVRRLCNCDTPSAASPVASFGTGYSGGFVNEDERTMFAHTLHPDSTHGVMTHFWSTAPYPVLENTIVRYYIDGEEEPSIEFLPPMACGSGFDEQFDPWGTKWFGKGANNGAWYKCIENFLKIYRFNNFRIPFEVNVRVTVQSLNQTRYGFYIILRGTPNLSFDIGGIPVCYNCESS